MSFKAASEFTKRGSELSIPPVALEAVKFPLPLQRTGTTERKRRPRIEKVRAT
jgi:hypothetical protein